VRVKLANTKDSERPLDSFICTLIILLQL